jgi:hypothetical protein
LHRLLLLSVSGATAIPIRWHLIFNWMAREAKPLRKRFNGAGARLAFI